LKLFYLATTLTSLTTAPKRSTGRADGFELRVPVNVNATFSNNFFLLLVSPRNGEMWPPFTTQSASQKSLDAIQPLDSCD
jgi:hypothetical protein